MTQRYHEPLLAGINDAFLEIDRFRGNSRSDRFFASILRDARNDHDANKGGIYDSSLRCRRRKISKIQILIEIMAQPVGGIRSDKFWTTKDS